MQNLDEEVLVKKEEISSLKSEYLEAKAKYELLLRKVKEETIEVKDLVENRDAAYINYLESSVRAYLPMDTDEVGQESRRGRGSWMDGVSAGGDMLLGGLSGLQGGLQKAPIAASAATGWLAASLTSKYKFAYTIASRLSLKPNISWPRQSE